MTSSGFFCLKGLLVKPDSNYPIKHLTLLCDGSYFPCVILIIVSREKYNLCMNLTSLDRKSLGSVRWTLQPDQMNRPFTSKRKVPKDARKLPLFVFVCFWFSKSDDDWIWQIEYFITIDFDSHNVRSKCPILI